MAAITACINGLNQSTRIVVPEGHALAPYALKRLADVAVRNSSVHTEESDAAAAAAGGAAPADDGTAAFEAAVAVWTHSSVDERLRALRAGARGVGAAR